MCMSFLAKVILLFIFFETCCVEGLMFNLIEKNVSNTLDNLLLPTRYSKKVRPEIGGPATKVMVNMHIKSIGPVSETEGSYTMDVYFRQQWFDKRLSFYLPGLEELTMSWLFLEKIWKPDTFFMNGKSSHLHRITSPNKFLRLRQDGLMMYSMRLTLTASCEMQFHKFPMDSQRCPLLIGSYGYSKRDILYEWTSEGLGLEPGVELAQYDLVNISIKNKQIVIRENEEFSMVLGTLTLRRNLGFFILQMYVPLSLIVCCSWVSFWIDPKAVPARVQLGVTTVLSITTMGFAGRAALPKVSYPTALDWFIIVCFAFAFGVIVEYAYINFIDKITADIKKILEERKKNKELEEKKKDGKRGSKESLTNPGSSQDPVTKSSDLNMSSPSTSRRPCVPRIQLTYESDEFEDIDADEDSVRKKKKTKHRSTLRKRRTASLPVLNRHSSLSSEESEKLAKICFHDKREAMTVFSKILNLEYSNSEATDSDKIGPVIRIRRAGRFKRSLRIPVKLLNKIKILPTETEIENQPEPELFTKLDIVSRLLFPLAYVCVMTMYSLYFAYYLSNEWEKDEL
uniref:Neurotransmitter-gated ion-channel ligand-binding domain-containing protein n=1 Tax=Cuerna arida TaxID=1464854 RepID=A0A1B6GS50_9HEMI